MIIRLYPKFKPKIIFKKKVFYCQIGKNGVSPIYKKKEGDKRTPSGKWFIEKIFIRPDKVKLQSSKKKIRCKIFNIYKNVLWCDDVNNKYYNKLVKHDPKKQIMFSHEKLYRIDDVYDLFIDLSYNKKPIVKGKGSAIFIHCSFSDFRKTNGCIALKKKDLKFLINNLQKKNYIYIR